MRSFAYNSAESLDDVITLLQTNPNTRPLAGGTDLLTLMKADIATPEQLVDIKRLPNLPRDITDHGDSVVIGALATLSDIEHSSLLQEHFPALVQAAGLAATPQLRNMATVGGNILQRPRCWYFRNSHFPCWLKGGEGCPAHDGENQLHAIFDQSPCVAVHPSDLASTLVAHNAEVLLRGSGGERSLPIEQFFAPPTDERRTENVLGTDELVIGLRVPASDMRSVYLKAMDRNVWAFALVGVAVAMRIDGDTVTEARVVLSGVAQTPWRSSAAEAALVGAAADEATWRAAAEAAVGDVVPLAHNGYKVALAQSLVRQALAALAAG